MTLDQLMQFTIGWMIGTTIVGPVLIASFSKEESAWHSRFLRQMGDAWRDNVSVVMFSAFLVFIFF